VALAGVAEALPLVSPLQIMSSNTKTLTVIPVAGSVMAVLAVVLQPLASVTVTFMVPAVIICLILSGVPVVPGPLHE
jgi:hypothetical protein